MTLSKEVKEAMVRALHNNHRVRDADVPVLITLPEPLVTHIGNKLVLAGGGVLLAQEYQKNAQLRAALERTLDMAQTYKIYQDDEARTQWPTEVCQALYQEVEQLLKEEG